MQTFTNRSEAGKLLAEKLMHYKNDAQALILALPRGGVPVAYEVAIKLHIPLDVFIARKLGLPGHEELAIGAIALGDVKVFNSDVLDQITINNDIIEKIISKEKKELVRRNEIYRNNRPLPIIEDRAIIIIDDGLATGATMRAAIKSIKKFNPARIIIAVPIAPTSIYALLRNEVDEVICLITHEPFYGVGMWYDEFPQTSDAEVCKLLAAAEKSIK